jgi:stress response protein SCP2
LYDNQGKETEACYFGNLKAGGGAIRHAGDNLTGKGDGDDEIIYTALDSIPEDIFCVMFCITAYEGGNFEHLKLAEA